MSCAEEEEEEEEWSSEKSPEFDREVANSIISTLQRRGENVLMDELIEAANVEEWEVARILDVLVSLQLAGIERQRGNTLRSSRAFAYRNGYALSKPVPLDTLRDTIAEQELIMTERLANLKKLKGQLESGNSESDQAFLKAYVEGKKLDTPGELAQRFLVTQQQPK